MRSGDHYVEMTFCVQWRWSFLCRLHGLLWPRGYRRPCLSVMLNTLSARTVQDRTAYNGRRQKHCPHHCLPCALPLSVLLSLRAIKDVMVSELTDLEPIAATTIISSLQF